MTPAASAADGPALALSGGGARAAYQVGVLLEIAERATPETAFPIITGVSAGSINAGVLAGCTESLREGAQRLERAWLGLSVSGVFRSGLFSLGGSAFKLATMVAGGGEVVRGLLDTTPLRRTLGGQIDPDCIDRNIRAGRLRALALTATSYASGRTVTFVHAPDDVPLWRRAGRVAVRTRIGAPHVMASCALPLLFPAVKIGQRYCGDGSLRQMAPLAPAIHLGAQRLLVVSVRHDRRPGEGPAPLVPGYPPPARVLGMLLNAVFLDAVEADAERLERINRSLRWNPTSTPHPDGLRPVDLIVLRPSVDLGELSADLLGSLPRGLRLLLRGLGIRGGRHPDLLSYLMFERPYIERLIDLGRRDAADAWPRLEAFFAPRPVVAS